MEVCLGLGLAKVQGSYIIVIARTVQWFIVFVVEVKMFCVCVCVCVCVHVCVYVCMHVCVRVHVCQS